ncbi:MAG: carbohydrate-binding protein [Verrucomicrobiota bacterium]
MTTAFTLRSTALLALSACSLLSQELVWTPGVTVQVYDIRENMTEVSALVPNQTPNLDQVQPTIDFDNTSLLDPQDGYPFYDQFLVHISAEINAPFPGIYEFALESDDGSLLFLNDTPICDNDGIHGPTTVTNSASLSAGWQKLRIEAFNNIGDFFLQLRWKQPGESNFTLVPQSSLRIDNNVVRVISHGKKFLLNNTNLSPGNGLPLTDVHPAWELTTIRPASFEPQIGAMSLVNDNTLYLGTFNPNQQDDSGFDSQPRIWRVDNVDGDPANITATQVAGSGLPATAQTTDISGMAWVNGDLFIAERTGIFRMLDANNDGLFEDKELIGDPWSWDNFHQFPFCLKHRAEPDGDYLYGAISVAIALGGNSDSNREDFRGSVFRLKIPPAGSTNSVEYLAGGFRTPNGVGFGPNGGLLVTDNQGNWNPANSLVRVENGRFYGHYNPTDVFPPPADFTAVAGRFENQPVSPKTVHVPQNEVSNSPTDIVTIPSGTFAGQLLVGELTAGGIRRVFLEEVNGEYQGALFRHSQGFEAGINRMRLASDGTLYLGGIGSNGGWSYQNLTHGLQRLSPKSNPPSVFEIHSIKALSTGLEITFTEPVPTSILDNPASYLVDQWRYLPTFNYGGPKIDETPLTISATQISADRKTVQLTLNGMLAGHLLHLRTTVRDDNNNALRSGEAWYTMNQIPTADGTPLPPPEPPAPLTGPAYNPASLAYKGRIPIIPTRIQAENYDTGGNSVSFFDFELANQGGSYRFDGVDVENSSDLDQSPSIGWASNTEWLQYSLQSSTGKYTLTARAASPEANPGKLVATIDGQPLTTIDITNTGDWDIWQDFPSSPFTLDSGPKTLRLTFTGADFNLNWVEFKRTPAIPPSSFQLDLSNSTTPNPTTPFSLARHGSNLHSRFETHYNLLYLLHSSQNLKDWTNLLTISGNDSIAENQIPLTLPSEGSFFLQLEIKEAN